MNAEAQFLRERLEKLTNVRSPNGSSASHPT